MLPNQPIHHQIKSDDVCFYAPHTPLENTPYIVDIGMSSGYIAFIAVLVLIILYIVVYRKTNEGFLSYTVEDTQAKAACAPKTLVSDPIKPDVAQLGVGTIQPSAAVGSIPSSSYTPSRAAALPYRNVGTEPARYIQILSAMEQIQAFFGFEAPALESECSPSVALPLQQARADLGQLITQVDVLERNPGVPSSITSKELAQIMGNVRYLQKEARKLKAVSGTELLGGHVASVEGVEGFSNLEIDTESEDADIESKTPATLDQLKAFKSAVDAAIETLRTATANSQDAVTVRRIAALDRLRHDVEDIIGSVEEGDLAEDQIPIYAEDIEAITANLGDTSKTIGTIIRNVALPPALAKLFPGDMSMKDKITLEDIGADINSYMNELTNGLSWTAKGDIGVELKYDSQRAVDIARARNIRTSNLNPGGTDLYSADEDMTSGLDNSNSMATRVQDTTNEIGALSRESGLNADGTRLISAEPVVGGFDWKERAGHICASIKKAGMEPASFGCVDSASVSDTYSWRGNVAMVCNRLEGTTDPGLPLTMGCPPRTWDGWRT
jgi:hypothetical protein